MKLEKFEGLRENYIASGGEIEEFKKQAGKVDIGYKISYSKKITEADVYAFGLVSGDWNPIHFDDEFASQTKFGKRVAHGMLTTSLVSAAVAQMPGIIVLLKTDFSYLKPVSIGDVVEVKGEVVGKNKNRFTLEIGCYVGDEKVVSGEVKLLIW
ncbi:acyl dehydratase [Archaeoglobales archaeon]|nr:MAG: acyl dehydratase [Archaeoglobales archaeon]